MGLTDEYEGIESVGGYQRYLSLKLLHLQIKKTIPYLMKPTLM